MNAQSTGKKTTARLLIALLAVALVLTMMPLSMGKVFAATEDTPVQGLEVTGDVAAAVTYKDMKEMKNAEAITPIKKSDVPFHGINRMLTPLDVTVDGVTINDLVTKVAGLKANAKLIGVTAESTGKKPGETFFTAEQIQSNDLQGNQMMFAWGMKEDKKYKVQTVIRGQFDEGDINRSDWYTDVTKITVKALDKPAVTVKAGKKKAVIKWKGDADAEKYNVLRATKKAGKYQSIKTVKGKTSFTDKKVKKGKTYYYKVEAVAGAVKNVSAAKKAKIK